ncbi:tryptophan halogenase family protein [Pseudobowmanella zhangzhouensis]|uniref:tryptophan halogenase family protein n=1 Tax=Pseudobowmanella zhangzhouensis TaxID=1537679 RepID=UPI00361BFC58
METPKKISSVIVLGGGTAGWLTANHLAKKLQPGTANGVCVTLIESPDIPTIGVGEGTVLTIRDTLKYLGISETELLRECDATFKQSIEFINWMAPSDRQTHRYHHVFDYPPAEYAPHLLDWVMQKEQKPDFANAFSYQQAVIEAGKAPKGITHPEYEGVCNYAYHFDAAKFGQLLARHARTNLGVKHIQANISRVDTDEAGNICCLHSDQGQQFVADLFVDCSGANSTLLGQTLNVPFISKKAHIFTDTALAVQVPYTDPQQPIACSTLATAQQAGWIWDIGLTTRRGVGLVYASDFQTEQSALDDLQRYLGTDADALTVRKIPMRTGYYERFWQGNCVAVGMSQGFVEPLEATGLLLFDVSARMLAEQFPVTHQDICRCAARYNKKLRYAWDRVLDFVKLHYCISNRRDSEFWLAHQDSNTWSATLEEDIQHWQRHLPSQYDFTDRASVFNLENHLYVLYGMQFNTMPAAFLQQQADHTQAQQFYRRIADYAQQAAKQLPEHRDLLQRIARFGLQPL